MPDARKVLPGLPDGPVGDDTPRAHPAPRPLAREANWRDSSNLMARDDFKNLGFKDDAPAKPSEGGETEAKGELRW